MLRRKENETDRVVVEEVEEIVVDSFTIDELDKRIQQEDDLIVQHTKQAERLRTKLRDALNIIGSREQIDE